MTAGGFPGGSSISRGHIASRGACKGPGACGRVSCSGRVAVRRRACRRVPPTGSAGREGHGARQWRTRRPSGPCPDPSRAAGSVERSSVVAVTAGQRHPQRSAAGIGQRMMLRARPGAVNRARTDFWAASPSLGPHMRVVDGGGGEAETVRRPQPVQQHPLELLPHPGLLPLGRPPPAGRTRTEPQLLRQELPLDRCRGRTAHLGASCGHRSACAPGTGTAAHASATAARSPPTTRH